MKFSVLIPTRNRLELLRYAVASVQRQDWSDWEVIVSDNDSAEDVRGFVEALREPRVRYSRTSRFVPVTENWNRALEQSTGDYVVMLGDDDGLLQGYFREMAALLERHAHPEAAYTDAFQFAYPGVIPGRARPFMQVGYNAFLGGRAEPFLLSLRARRALVRASMRLRLEFSYNMQHFVFGRAAIARLAAGGSFFQSPYPDYYAGNALLLLCERVLAVPRPMVVIGISPKSFGYYYFNDRAAEGTAFLATATPERVPAELAEAVLPGNELLTSWFLAMHALERNFAAAHGMRADRRRYRRLQALHAHLHADDSALAELRRRLSGAETLGYGLWMALARALGLRLALRAWASLISPWPRFDARVRDVGFENLLELVEATPAAYY